MRIGRCGIAVVVAIEDAPGFGECALHQPIPRRQHFIVAARGHALARAS